MANFHHKPVLPREVVAALEPRAAGRYLDATLGKGNHAWAILKASSPDGWLIGFDRDAEAIAAARETLREFEGRFEIHHDNFSNMARYVEPGSCQGILIDLGVSSHQVDAPDRGFSFTHDGPLDMRMDRGQPLTAAEVVNEWDERELARLFRDWGEEPQARRFARALVRERAQRRIETTGQLAGLIERLAPRHGRKRHPATRVFQALRMAVNNEEESLRSAMAAACPLLAPGGRLAVISFHSIEDRIVKQFGVQVTRDYRVEGDVDLPEFRHPIRPLMRWIQKKPVVAGAEELADNPRARSAKLRVLEKI